MRPSSSARLSDWLYSRYSSPSSMPASDWVTSPPTRSGSMPVRSKNNASVTARSVMRYSFTNGANMAPGSRERKARSLSERDLAPLRRLVARGWEGVDPVVVLASLSVACPWAGAGGPRVGGAEQGRRGRSGKPVRAEISWVSPGGRDDSGSWYGGKVGDEDGHGSSVGSCRDRLDCCRGDRAGGRAGSLAVRLSASGHPRAGSDRGVQQRAHSHHRPDHRVCAGSARLYDRALQSATSPSADAHLAQHRARNHVDGGPGADPDHHRHPVVQVDVFHGPGAGPGDDNQSHRPSMVLVLRISRRKRARLRQQYGSRR